MTSSSNSTHTAIKVHDLGKSYRIYESPKDRLKQAFWRGRRQYYREFWALRNVSLEVQRGEQFSIIGRNGSGKSTLLQLICGTLTPTEGTVECSGKIAALLELGSGFNPEFTGVENVALNAALLGLSHGQIVNRMDDILAFADIGDFAYQPVKSYSSGMQVRLAFAVIAHVDADILICDEALSVGDAVFTQRCMRFIRQFKDTGTLLFVSHDMSSVTALTDRCLWIHEGTARYSGNSRTGVQRYSDFCQEVGGYRIKSKPVVEFEDDRSEDTVLVTPSPFQLAGKSEHPSVRALQPEEQTALDLQARRMASSGISIMGESGQKGYTDGIATIVGSGLRDETGKSINLLEGGRSICLVVECLAGRMLHSPIVGFQVMNMRGQVLFGDNSYIQGLSEQMEFEAGIKFMASFQFVWPWLAPGEYTITLAVSSGDYENHVNHHWINEAMVFSQAHAPKHVSGLFAPLLTSINMEIMSQGAS